MSGGKNGSTPVQNLAHLRSKRVFETNAEVESSKCPTHPTKRMWTDPIEAIREAEARTIAAKMPIAAYRCDACHDIHLAKRANIREGSLIERPPVREEEPPLVLGNVEAKRKALREFLESRTTTTTAELCELLGVKRKSLTTYMAEHDWYNTRGAHAVWKPRHPAEQPEPAPMPAKLTAVDKPVDKPIELAKRRHPSAAQVGWRPMGNVERIRHLALGDLLDTFHAAGMEIRIMVRQDS